MSDWLTAEALVSILFDSMVEGRPLPPVVQRPEHGATDIELWERMRSGQDLLDGRPFEWAVQTDPRRVDLMIQSFVVNDFTAVLDLPRGPEVETLNAWWYCRALSELRAVRGQVDAVGLAELAKGTWNLYSQLLQVSLKMRRPGTPAERMWRLLIDHHVRVLAAFRSGQDVAIRAANVTASPDDRAAWLQVSSILDDMRVAFINSAATLGHALGEPTAVEEFGSLMSWELHARDRWREGNRAPYSRLQAATFRSSGGRI